MAVCAAIRPGCYNLGTKGIKFVGCLFIQMHFVQGERLLLSVYFYNENAHTQTPYNR